MVSKIERDVGQGVRGNGLARHFLKEGLCDVVGYDFDSFQAKRSESAPTYATYEDYMLDCAENRSRPLAQLADEHYYSLEKNNQAFAEYLLGGSLVSSLVEKYGFETVLSYFVAEAEAGAKEERKVRDEIEAENRRYGNSEIQITYQTEADPSHVPQIKELDDLLIELGYTREDFEGMTKVSEPFDARPEGGIAATIYEVISTMVREDIKGEVSYGFPERARTKKTEGEPSFVDLAMKSLDTQQAKGVFGTDFSAHDFVMKWREKILALEK